MTCRQCYLQTVMEGSEKWWNFRYSRRRVDTWKQNVLGTLRGLRLVDDALSNRNDSLAEY